VRLIIPMDQGWPARARNAEIGMVKLVECPPCVGISRDEAVHNRFFINHVHRLA